MEQNGSIRERATLLLCIVASAAMTANCSGFTRDDLRFPEDEEPAWDPNLPLMVLWSESSDFPPDNDNLWDGFSLTTADGEPVPFIVKVSGEQVLLCPEGGLREQTTYTWKVGPFGNNFHQIKVPGYSLTGTWQFETAEASEHLAPLCYIPSDFCGAGMYPDTAGCL